MANAGFTYPYEEPFNNFMRRFPNPEYTIDIKWRPFTPLVIKRGQVEAVELAYSNLIV
jgi:hypothetical protein